MAEGSNANMPADALEKLRKLSGRRTSYFLKKKPDDGQMELDLKPERRADPEPEKAKDSPKLPADFTVPVSDPQFGALCIALYNVYCSDYATEVTFKITKR